MSLLVEARELFAKAIRETDRRDLLIGFSGGKDSLVTLDLALRSELFTRIEVFYMYHVKGLRCVEPFIEKMVKRFGIKLHKVPHWELPYLVHNAYLMPHYKKAEKIRRLKLVDLERILTSDTGIGLFAYGARVNESLARRGYIGGMHGLDAKARRVWPIWNWKRRDVFAYLRNRRIPYPESFGMRDRGAAGLQPRNILWLKENYPDDYEKYRRTFPFIEVIAEAKERFGTYAETPKVQCAQSSPQPAEERALQPQAN